MTELMRKLELGSVTAAVINIGDITLPLAAHMNQPQADLAQRGNLAGLLSQITLPINFLYLELPEIKVLVDAGVYELEPNSPYQIPNYTPPPSLVEQLAQIGVTAAEIDHIIITHRHWDHFNGTTIQHEGQYVPCFPNARHYLSRIDWERASSALQGPSTVEYRTLRVLHKQGLLELVDGDYDLGAHIKIIAAPGETRGHQIVRVLLANKPLGDKTLYCLGDLYHHPAEFEDQGLMVAWARPETTHESRRAFMARALQEDALLMATHIPGIGRLQQTEAGHTVWQSV